MGEGFRNSIESGTDKGKEHVKSCTKCWQVSNCACGRKVEHDWICNSCNSAESSPDAIELRAKIERQHVTPEHCHAKVMKGSRADGLPENMLVLDTGQPELPPVEKREPQTPEEVDELYRETIRGGTIDHHSIDAAVLTMPAGAERRCATKMIADFPDEVVAMIKERKIESVSGHIDSDLDSIASTFLARSLVQSKSVADLPAITEQLAEIVNLTDYGKFREADPEKYATSLPGVFGALKDQIMDMAREQSGAVWRDATLSYDEKRKKTAEISDVYHEKLITAVFEILNACNRQKLSGEDVDLAALDLDKIPVPEELRKMMKKGKELTIETRRVFDREFEKAEKREVTVQDKLGRSITVPLVIFAETELSPLEVTNLAYQRLAPEAIIAVYAGQDRTRGGDTYDIGIKPETAADVFSLELLEQPFNAAEAEKREPILAELDAKVADGTITPEEKKRLDLWRTPRKGKEHLGIGDPTVLVAGGSLIAASNTSLLNSEDFRRVLQGVFTRG